MSDVLLSPPCPRPSSPLLRSYLQSQVTVALTGSRVLPQPSPAETSALCPLDCGVAKSLRTPRPSARGGPGPARVPRTRSELSVDLRGGEVAADGKPRGRERRRSGARDGRALGDAADPSGVTAGAAGQRDGAATEGSASFPEKSGQEERAGARAVAPRSSGDSPAGSHGPRVGPSGRGCCGPRAGRCQPAARL